MYTLTQIPKNRVNMKPELKMLTPKLYQKPSWSLPAQFIWLTVSWRWGAGKGRLIICSCIYLTILELKNKENSHLCFCSHQQNCTSKETMKLIINRSLQSAPSPAICNQQPWNKEGQSEHGEASLLVKGKMWRNMLLQGSLHLLRGKLRNNKATLKFPIYLIKVLLQALCYNMNLTCPKSKLQNMTLQYMTRG